MSYLDGIIDTGIALLTFLIPKLILILQTQDFNTVIDIGIAIKATQILIKLQLTNF